MSIVRKPNFPTHGIVSKAKHKVFSTKSGWVAYKESPWHWVMAGEPCCESREDISVLIEEFSDAAKKKRKGVCGFYFSEGFESSSFKKNLIGTSTFINLKNFQLSGWQSRDVRRALNRGKNDELEFLEINVLDDKKWQEEVDSLHQKWICTKRGPRIGFLLSPPKISKSSRAFLVIGKDKKLQAYASLFEYSKNGKISYYLDDMIQEPEGYSFAIDYLISKLILRLRDEGAEKVSLGLNAFDEVKAVNLSAGMMRIVEKLQWPYKSQGLYRFKRKYGREKEKNFFVTKKKDNHFMQWLSLAWVTYIL